MTVTDSAVGGRRQPYAFIVMVKVTNVEEPGTVTLSAQEPQEEIPLTATLSDPDNVTTDSDKWQWARSRNGSSGWTDIEDEDEDEFGKTATYTPVNDDVGYYLRATVTYKDGESAADVSRRMTRPPRPYPPTPCERRHTKTRRPCSKTTRARRYPTTRA